MTHLSANINRDRTISFYEGTKKVFRGTVEDFVKFFSGPNDLKPAKVKKVREKSRTQRWNDAAAEAVAALETLQEIQGEYQEWLDNLPENLQNGSPVSEKLEGVTNIDIDSALSAAQEAESADLPMGFGRD